MIKNKKIVVIGGDAAGMTAASKIRREQPDYDIVVFERGNHTSYSACGMPYYIGGQIKSEEHLIARKPEVFRQKQNIDVRIRHEVIEIDPEEKRVKAINLDSGDTYWEQWDNLLIATGASPFVPEMDNIDARGVFSLSTLQSGIDVFEYIKRYKPTKAVVVGGGYIGIEMAEALNGLDMDVTLIDMALRLMTTLDYDMSEIVLDHIRSYNVNVFLEEKLLKFEKNSEGRVKSVVTDKQAIPAEIVILGMGVKPNSELAARAGIKLGVNNAIQVNTRLETNLPNIWAAGDCAESYHLVAKKQVHIALGTVANKHGLVAGINISGGNAEFSGVLGTAITKFHHLEISRTGLSEKEAKDLGINFYAELITSVNPAGYYPGSGKITVKMLVDKQTKQILGGQIVGVEGSAKRIDTIATAITAKFTAQQLVDLDLSYAPPFSSTWDPVQIAARKF